MTARRLELAIAVVIGAAIVLLGANLYLAHAHDRVLQRIERNQ